MGVFYRTSRVKVVDITPKDNPHEVIVGLCSLRGTSRKMIRIGDYRTTAIGLEELEVFLDCINDLVHSFKARYKDPYLIIAGDWNKAETDIAFEDFVNIVPIPMPPTRGDEVLDIIFTNMNSTVTVTDVCPPLIPNSGMPGRPSDHNIVAVQFELPRSQKFRWLNYSYRKYTKEGDEAFGDWILGHEWGEIKGDPSTMAAALGVMLDKAMEAFFPLITRRLRSDPDSWVNESLKKKIVRRKKIFKIQGRSKSWKKVKKRTEAII